MESDFSTQLALLKEGMHRTRVKKEENKDSQIKMLAEVKRQLQSNKAR